MQKCYSTDDETFSKGFPEYLEAGQVYYEASYKDTSPEDYVKRAVFSLIEDLDQSVYEDVGEIYQNDFSEMHLNPEAMQELRTAIEDWVKKYVKLPYFVVVGKSVEKTATEDDV